MIYLIKQVGKDLYYRCEVGGCSFVSLGEASTTRRPITVESTLKRLKECEAKRRGDCSNTDPMEFEVVAFDNKDLAKFFFKWVQKTHTDAEDEAIPD